MTEEEMMAIADQDAAHAAEGTEAKKIMTESEMLQVNTTYESERRGSILILYRDQAIRALNLFVGAIANMVSRACEFTEAEAAGFRNLIRACAREGGKNVKGYYSILPSAKSLQKVMVDGEERNPIDQKKVESLREAATKVTAKLLEVLATKDTQKSQYSHDGTPTKVVIPVGLIGDAIPDAEAYTTAWEDACAKATQPGGFYVEDF